MTCSHDFKLRINKDAKHKAMYKDIEDRATCRGKTKNKKKVRDQDRRERDKIVRFWETSNIR